MSKNKQELETSTREERNYLEASERFMHAEAQEDKWKRKKKEAKAEMESFYDDLQAARSGQKNLSGFNPGSENPEAE